MDEIRVAFSIVIFTISSYLVYDLFAHGFDWIVLAVSIAGYLLVHYVWPRRSTGENAWFDPLEFIFDLPYRAIALLIRSLGKLSRNNDGDIGIDL